MGRPSPVGHRVSMPQVRASFAPRAFAGLSTVSLEAGGRRAEVQIQKLPDGGCRGGMKRWFRCPGCGSKTLILWSTVAGWGCRRCAR